MYGVLFIRLGDSTFVWAENMGVADQAITAIGVVQTSAVPFSEGVALAAIGEAMVIFGARKPDRTLIDAGAVMAK